MRSLQDYIKKTDKDKDISFEIAKILARVTIFLSPKIVKKIIDLNANFILFNEFNYVDFPIESDCVFPGVKRKRFNKGDRKRKYDHEMKVISDTNEYPRHIWCGITNGNLYSGPAWKKLQFNRFELAHIFQHRESTKGKAFIFTSASSIVLIPKGLAKPTDLTENNFSWSEDIRNIFYNKHKELYEPVFGKNYKKYFPVLDKPNSYQELEWGNPEGYEPDNWEEHIEKFNMKRIDHLKGKID